MSALRQRLITPRGSRAGRKYAPSKLPDGSNARLRADGALPIGCPINDGSGVHGIGIFDRDVEETRAIMDADPGVQAGVFVYELHPCRGFPGSVVPA